MRFVWIAACVALGMSAQETPDRITVPFGAPGQPKKVRVELLTGSITVRSHAGPDVIVEAQAPGSSRRTETRTDGLRRLDAQGSGLRVDQSENTIRIGSSALHIPVSITVQTPRDTSLVLKTVNGGQVLVESINGDIEAHNTNGAVTLTNVSGTVVAHSLNGTVKATLDQVTAGKPMSFSTLNGDIDVTLPADTKANLRMKTDHGEVYTDFDVKLGAQPAPEPAAEPAKGRYRIRMDRGVQGTINGGGPEFRFTTLNGRIYLRKKG